MTKFPQPPLYFYNTETRKKEKFHPLVDNQVRLYTCGPTVYHYAHIGNFRTYLFEDLLRRTLKFFGYEVMQTMNLTDVDDKTIRGANAAEVSLKEYTQAYKNAFFVDLQTLNIERVENYPCATDYIPHMIDFIQKLLDKNIAYQSRDRSVYFSIEKCAQYGRLSHLQLEQLKEGASVSSDEYDKDNIGDFVLWKAYDPKRDGKIFWKSPFGPGRPGWHLECSTMAMQLLGETLDIHAGGVDNIFPHHENEIAQSEAYSGKPLARFWLHAEHLVVENRKMSKSLGNVYTLQDLIHKGFSGMQVRYLLMHTHYRTPLNFTFQGLEGAKNSLQRVNDFIQKMQEIAEDTTPISTQVQEILDQTVHQFCHAMADDLNVSVALAAVFDLVHQMNVLYDEKRLKRKEAVEALYVLEEFNRILGVFDFEEKDKIPQEMQELLCKRDQARKEKKWEEADAIREEILSKGYVIEDTSEGVRLKHQ